MKTIPLKDLVPKVADKLDVPSDSVLSITEYVQDYMYAFLKDPVPYGKLGFQLGDFGIITPRIAKINFSILAEIAAIRKGTAPPARLAKARANISSLWKLRRLLQTYRKRKKIF